MRVEEPSLVSTVAEYAGLIPIVAINVPDRSANKDECYVKALEINPKYATAWYNLGAVCGGGTVNGKHYTRDQRALHGRLPS